MTTCRVINRSSKVSASELSAALRAGTAWAAGVAKAWDVPAVTLTASSHAPTFGQIILQDGLDEPGAAGYHDVEAGRPVGKVDVAGTLAAGMSWTVTLTHELGEMMVDPWCVAAAQYARDSWIAYELCLSGDTPIPLLNGSTVPLRDLHGLDEFWVYSCDTEGHVVPGRAHSARITRRGATMVDVELDNSEVVRCTPDHPFMLRDGTYVTASNLTVGASLMPLYRRFEPIVGGGKKLTYEQVLDPATSEWRFTHRVVVPDCPVGSLRHHVDFDRYNNEPGNLQVVTGAEHRSIHHDWVRQAMADGTHYFVSGHSEAHRRESSERMAAYNRSAAHRAQAVELGRNAMTKLWDQPEFREHHRNRGRELVKTFDQEKRVAALRARYTDPDFARKASETATRVNHVRWHANRGITKPGCDLCAVVNHKVVAVRPAPSEDAWDFAVDEHHNFAVDAGVFVHNCDPVEGDQFGLTIDGVLCSDYLLPGYFAGTAPFDAGGHLTHPAPALLADGYASVAVGGKWGQVSAEELPVRAVGSRRHALRVALAERVDQG